MIAIGGEWGTLSEIGFARAIGRTVIALRSWTLSGRERMEGAPGVAPRRIGRARRSSWRSKPSEDQAVALSAG